MKTSKIGFVSRKNWTKVIPKPLFFLDMGVGKVNTEAYDVHRSWPKTKIIGLEPDIGRYNQCKLSYPGKLINCAVGRKNGFTVMQKTKGPMTVFPRKYHITRDTVKVKVRSIDSLNNEFGPFKKVFIWADIEGSEMEMLLGARKLINSGEVIGFNLELWDAFQSKNWCLKKEVVEFLKKRGFEIKYSWRKTPDRRPLANRHNDYIFLKC
jgi:FkbM family methyltransferase